MEALKNNWWIHWGGGAPFRWSFLLSRTRRRRAPRTSWTLEPQQSEMIALPYGGSPRVGRRPMLADPPSGTDSSAPANLSIQHSSPGSDSSYHVVRRPSSGGLGSGDPCAGSPASWPPPPESQTDVTTAAVAVSSGGGPDAGQAIVRTCFERV